MGNICCEQQPVRQNQPIRSVAAQRSPPPRNNAKTQKQLYLQEQKALLLDFSPAILYLSKNGKQNSQTQFKKFAVGSLITSDGIADYFKGTLVSAQQVESECVIKKIDKRKLISKNQKKALAIEYQVTRYLNHRFIVNCLHFYQDQSFLYLYFDLRHYKHLNAYTTEGVSPQLHAKFRLDLQGNLRFLIAGIVLGIEKLHQLHIVYRGINNENIVILQDGYPILTNLSRLHPEGYSTSQPSQVNPFTSLEQYKGQNLRAATDLWDLGVLMHFICKGKYLNFTSFKENEFTGEGLSLQLIDLVNRLLVLNPVNRLGAKNINQLKSHSFFNNFDWKAYSQKQLISPFRDENNFTNTCQGNDQRRQSNFSYDSNSGYGMMLFMDLATIYMLSEAFQNQQFQPQNIRYESEQDHNQGDQFQLATSINIADQFGGGFGSDGGDYD